MAMRMAVPLKCSLPPLGRGGLSVTLGLRATCPPPPSHYAMANFLPALKWPRLRALASSLGIPSLWSRPNFSTAMATIRPPINRNDVFCKV